MSIVGKSARAFIALVVLCICLAACPGQTRVAFAGQRQADGASRHIPAYYDGELFTINIMEVPNSDALTGHNRILNEIYVSNDLDEEQEFNPVIDAIQGDGFNPLWRQIFIVFNPGFTPHQFFSDEEVDAAAAGANPEIHLVESDEVYICAVVGKE
jgi:hypothetical protein